MKPAFLRHVALGNGGESGRSRFGCQQLVATRFQTPRSDVIADGQDLPALVVEEPKVHLTDQPVRFRRERPEPLREGFRLAHRRRQQFSQGPSREPGRLVRQGIFRQTLELGVKIGEDRRQRLQRKALYFFFRLFGLRLDLAEHLPVHWQ